VIGLVAGRWSLVAGDVGRRRSPMRATTGGCPYGAAAALPARPGLTIIAVAAVQALVARMPNLGPHGVEPLPVSYMVARRVRCVRPTDGA
jgi:hypothetical protein